MDILYNLKLAASSFAVILLLRWAWRLLNWVWLKPKEVEKRLRQQGFKGNSYKIFFGDLKEMKKMREDALSKPINFSHDMTWPRVMPFIHKTITTYGENCFAWFGTKPAVVIMEPELVREVLSKNYIFQKPPINAVTIIAKGIVSYETDKWAKHRRLLNPAFHLDKLKHMLPAFQLTACEMLSKWEKIVSPNGSEIDVWPYLQALTSDAISRTAFGSSYEEGKQIFELQKEQLQLLLQASFAIYIPGWRFVPTKWNKRMKQLFNEIREQVLGIINKRMRMIEAGEASDDLLGILLAENLKEIQQHGNTNFGMHIDEVIEECKLFYFAGQETTASLLVWTMILLCKHPNWQDRAREEVLRVFGSNKLLDYNALNQLKVVTMILNEVLRLYPGAYRMNRMVPRETKLGNLCLPAGVQLLLPTILLHQDTKIWGDDAMEFKPERFSDGVAKTTKGQVVFFPFSWGPRICIGQNFAMLEAKMAIAMILKNYAFELSPSYAHAPHPLLLQPQYGAQLIFHKL